MEMNLKVNFILAYDKGPDAWESDSDFSLLKP
jgi:hypothetical protein